MVVRSTVIGFKSRPALAEVRFDFALKLLALPPPPDMPEKSAQENSERGAKAVKRASAKNGDAKLFHVPNSHWRDMALLLAALTASPTAKNVSTARGHFNGNSAAMPTVCRWLTIVLAIMIFMFLGLPLDLIVPRMRKTMTPAATSRTMQKTIFTTTLE